MNDGEPEVPEFFVFLVLRDLEQFSAIEFSAPWTVDDSVPSSGPEKAKFTMTVSGVRASNTNPIPEVLATQLHEETYLVQSGTYASSGELTYSVPIAAATQYESYILQRQSGHWDGASYSSDGGEQWDRTSRESLFTGDWATALAMPEARGRFHICDADFTSAVAQPEDRTFSTGHTVFGVRSAGPCDGCGVSCIRDCGNECVGRRVDCAEEGRIDECYGKGHMDGSRDGHACGGAHMRWQGTLSPGTLGPPPGLPAVVAIQRDRVTLCQEYKIWYRGARECDNLDPNPAWGTPDHYAASGTLFLYYFAWTLGGHDPSGQIFASGSGSRADDIDLALNRNYVGVRRVVETHADSNAVCDAQYGVDPNIAATALGGLAHSLHRVNWNSQTDFNVGGAGFWGSGHWDCGGWLVLPPTTFLEDPSSATFSSTGATVASGQFAIHGDHVTPTGQHIVMNGSGEMSLLCTAA